MISTLLTRRSLLTLVLTCALTAPTVAQTLARPGWQGSGIATDLWWKHAIFYEVDPARFNPLANEAPLRALLQRLDYIHDLGIDAILLTPVATDAAHPTRINPNLGTLDDFDDLLREASRRDLRVLLELNSRIASDELPAVARFWLNRGVAGFHLIGSGATEHAQAESLRAITSAFLGRRILIADADPSLPFDPRQRTYKAPNTQSAELLLSASLARQDKLAASSVRPVLGVMQDIFDAGRSLPLLATDGEAFQRSFTRYADGQHDVAIAKVLATILLATRAESLLYYGQELGVPSPDPVPPITWSSSSPNAKRTASVGQTTLAAPNAALEEADSDSLLNWYRQLIALHHGSATIASGSSITIDEDDKDVLVWIRKPHSITPRTPALVIVCNLTGEPVTLSLTASLKHLQLRGSFLRTVLRSDKGMGTMHLDSMTIAPYTAYVGQLQF